MPLQLVVVVTLFRFKKHMKIITWNVNSVRARLPQVELFLKEQQPDVLLLQELKCEDHGFPTSLLDYGYNCALFGQKTYNGVAILSKHPIEDIQKGIPNFEDPASRYIEAFTGGVRVASVYVPNGQEVGSTAYDYKLDFLSALQVHAKNLLTFDERLIIGGDFNIAPSDEDVHDPIAWQNQTLCTELERGAWRKITYLGLTDAVKQSTAGSMPYTWWDYRKGSFAKDDGLRIDHLLLSPHAADSLKTTKVHKNMRGLEKASDHAPVECVLII
jgi:exodeoxyribonuclease III